MSRSDYNDEASGWDLLRWRGAVASAMKGNRGQEFLREMLAAMDALPKKELIDDALIEDGSVCAIGSVALARKIDMAKLDSHDYDGLAVTFGIAPALVREIEWINDECGWQDTPEKRFVRVRKWIEDHIVA